MVDSCELIGLGGSDDDDDLHGTLTSFVCTDLGAESDTGYTSGVDGYFNSSTSLIDHCGTSDSTDAYCFRQFSLDSSLIESGACDVNASSSISNSSCSSGNNETNPLLICQTSGSINNINNLNNLGDFTSSSNSDNQSAITNLSGCSYAGGNSNSSTSSICSASNNYSNMINNNNNDYYSGNYYNDCSPSDMTCHQQQRQHEQHLHLNHSAACAGQSSSSSSSSSSGGLGMSTGAKRSVLMNLLIDGSDIGAGYSSINSRALQSIN